MILLFSYRLHLTQNAEQDSSYHTLIIADGQIANGNLLFYTSIYDMKTEAALASPFLPLRYNSIIDH